VNHEVGEEFEALFIGGGCGFLFDQSAVAFQSLQIEDV
jgi:hypothetical protein